MMLRTLFIILGILQCCQGKRNLPKNLYDQVHNQRDNVERIIEKVLRGDMKGQTYNKLAALVDKFGPRPTGSKSLEDAIDYVVDEMKKEGFDDVRTEEITAPKWVRGEESAVMTSPRRKKIGILSLGSSEGTPQGGIEADVIVVKSWDDLTANAAKARDKIVVYNQPWKGYFDTVQYRTYGASKAAEVGAKAALIRSMTDYSLYTPHTGQQLYNSTDASKHIPAVCITVEDAELMQRMQDRGETIRILLKMEAENVGDIKSRNIIADIRGTEKPEQLVMFGGHIDSWDVGQGAMDDGGGCLISWQALSVIKKLGLKPKRTMRVVLWTAEEIGLVGSNQFFDRHKDNQGNVSIVMESDFGTFQPIGIGFTGSGLARAIIEEILSGLKSLRTTTVGKDGSAPDTGGWKNIGVPVANYLNKNEKYFYYHHTEADTMDVEDPRELDVGTILWAVTAYVIASLDDILPRTGDYPSITNGSPQNIIRVDLLLILLLFYWIVSRSLSR